MTAPLPLLGLHAFTAVGRAGSMKLAARHLGVTPGAVSQQIKLLEARLGVLLFERRNRELRLTPAGAQLLGEVGDAFGRIEAAVSQLRAEHVARSLALTVSTTSSFAAAWLVPRLGRFVADHPRIDVRVLTTPTLVPLGGGTDSADIAIRHGLGTWPGLHAVRLLQPCMIPVGAPGLLQSGLPIRIPEDCLGYPLLHDPDAMDWRLWLRAMGAAAADPRLARGTRFADATLLARAAVAGQGLALVRDVYVADEIAAGRLQIAFDAPWPAQFAYYIVTRPEVQRRADPIMKFSAWLLREAAEEAA